MTIISQIYPSQQKKIQNHAKNANAPGFLKLLSCDELSLTIKDNIPPYRENIYTPMQTLSMFLAQTLNEDRSCSKAVIDMIIQKQSQENTRNISPNTGAYCLARQKLSLALLTELTVKIGEIIYQNTPEQWLWLGRRVCLIDGTTLTD